MTDKQRQAILLVGEHGFQAGPTDSGDVIVWLSSRPVTADEVWRAVPVKREFIAQDGPAVRILVGRDA